jgi:hypothetical protein
MGASIDEMFRGRLLPARIAPHPEAGGKTRAVFGDAPALTISFVYFFTKSLPVAESIEEPALAASVETGLGGREGCGKPTICG